MTAGGPKRLIFQQLDAWLFGSWLPSAPRERTLIGASIGAWRMAAACHADPTAAFQRLADLYCQQRYPRKPSAQYVSDATRDFVGQLVSGHEHEVATHPHYRLHILAARRALNWKLAISEGARLRDALADFVERPDLSLVQPI